MEKGSAALINYPLINSSKKVLPTGFSIIEMAVVLMVIGMILAVVAGGHKASTSAKGKKLVNFVNSWADLQWEHYDRYGRFAGDATAAPDRLIDDQVLTANNLPWPFYCVTGPNGFCISAAGVEDTVKQSDISLGRGFTNLPGERADASYLVLDSHKFYLVMGVDQDATGNYNIIIITDRFARATADVAIQSQEFLSFLAQIDAAIDGGIDTGSGRVRAITALGANVTDRTHDRSNLTQQVVPIFPAITPPWSVGTVVGLVYYFDRQLPDGS